MPLLKFLSLAGLLLFQNTLSAQYILNGSAEKNSCNCYTLTRPEEFKSGSVWNSNKINLTNPFDFWFNVFLGCSDAGADGLVFILQPISTSVGSSGEGMGFGGVTPSIGIALDTYQNLNLNDPFYDHISIQANGVINHTNDLTGPVPVSATDNNVEDCQWHKLRITWDPATKWLRTYFDGVLRLEKQVDLVTTIFNNDPNVYWGFTGATGGMVNLQQFCTALDPIFTTNFPNNVLCEGDQVIFSNGSESFAPIANYHWNFGDGSMSTAQNPPPHSYAAPGVYNVSLKIEGLDGCERDSSRTVTVASVPTARLQVYDTCFGNVPRVEFANNNVGVNYTWELNGSPLLGSQPPQVFNLAEGNHAISVTVTSTHGCGVPSTAIAPFIIKPQPVIDAVITDGCVNETMLFKALQVNPNTTISNWHWLVNNTAFSTQNFQYLFAEPSIYTVKLWTEADNGCRSDTVAKTISIARANLLVRDTTLVQNMPGQLQAVGNGNIVWSPSFGLSDAFSATPIATLNADQQYTVTVRTPEGCTEQKLVLVKVFKGPAVYVPSAFSPNGDGKNEILLPVYVGIKELKNFTVYNRWGQLVFNTKSIDKGWAGSGMTGTFVWVVQAIDSAGKTLSLKGTVIIIR